MFAKTGELTSEATRLILPDTQLQRLGLPPPENSQKASRLFFFDEANVSWCPKTGRVYRQREALNIRWIHLAKTSGNTSSAL